MSMGNLSQKEKQSFQNEYLEGLKKYHAKGIPIIIDGMESDEKDWEKIFEVREDQYFYMGDYVSSDDGKLEEIHFDKVYYT